MSLLLAPTKPPVIDDMMTSNSAQSSAGLVVRSYCNSVLSQPKVNFQGFKNLEKFETEVNAGIDSAKTRANHYLNDIEPMIITNITNISQYFDLHQAVATTQPPDATKKQWLDALAAMRDQVNGYEENAKGVVTELQGLHQGLTTDVAAFSSTVSQLNAAVNGDNGVLETIDKEVSSIDGKVAGAITGIVLSGLAVVGGSIMILVGALSEVVTGGAATLLVVGGVAVLAAGVGGAIGSGLALAGLLDAKADLLTKKANLKAEVQLATGMSTGFKALASNASSAVTAASNMQAAWTFLASDLDSLSTDLTKGIISPDVLRTIWLTTANSAIKRVQGDIVIIKNQMTGVQDLKAPNDVPISQFVKQTAEKLDAAA